MTAAAKTVGASGTAPGGHYTWQEFRQKTGKGPNEYIKYQRYVANTNARRQAARAKAAAAPTDPWAPTPPAEGQRQAVSMANFSFAPAIAAQEAAGKRQQEMFAKAMTQYTQGLSGALAPKADEAYGWARQQAADVGATAAGLAPIATGQAAQGQQAVADYLGRIGAPEASKHFASDVGARGNSMASVVAAGAQAGQQGILERGGGLAQLLSGMPSLAAMGGRRTLKSGLSELGSKNLEALAGLRSKRGDAIATNMSDFRNRELSKLIGSTGITKANISANAGITKAQIAANAKVVATAKTQAAKPPTLKTGAKGGLFKVNPDGSLTRTAPDGTMSVPKSAKPTTYKPVDRAAVETSVATNAGDLAIALAEKTKTIKPPGPLDPGYNPGVQAKTVPLYSRQQAAQLVFNQMWPAMRQFPQNTRASVMALARSYVNAAFG